MDKTLNLIPERVLFSIDTMGLSHSLQLSVIETNLNSQYPGFSKKKATLFTHYTFYFLYEWYKSAIRKLINLIE